MPTDTEAEVAAVVGRAGLRLTPAQLAELVAAQAALKAMLERNRAPLLGVEAEPATTFSAALPR